MKVPFVNLHLQHQELKNQIQKAINQVINRGDFILGQEVKLFEEEFAEFCGAKYAIGVSSGTAAIFLCLESLGIKEGDEVIVPTFTFIATALAVSYTGAKPVFVDINEESYNIDINQIKKAITPRTKAIIPVHLYGQPANMPEILKIAKENNLKVIEDACQAHGAQIQINGTWQSVGSIGDFGTFSFYPTKNLGGMGDAGIITTNNQELYRKLLILRDCGRVSKYEHHTIGYNSRLDTLQACVLRVKLKKLALWNELRNKAAQIYTKSLNEISGIATPKISEKVKHVFHVYAIRSKFRDQLLEHLKLKSIVALTHYNIPLHLQKAYQSLGYKSGDLPVAEKICQEIISLPMYPHLKPNQIKFVVEAIKEKVAK